MIKVRRGVTLVEMLVVLTIIAILSGLTFASVSSAKRLSKQSVATNNLKQMWHLIMLYASDYDTGTMPGKASQMGLPLLGRSLDLAIPNRKQYQLCEPQNLMVYWPDDESGPESWMESLVIAGDQVPMVVDENCGPSKWSEKNQYHPRTCIGIAYAGNALKLRKSGDPSKLAWWFNP